MMKMTGRALVASAVLGMGLVLFGATGAGASPSNAPSVRTGSLKCGSGNQVYPFTTNSGNSQAPVTWSALHLTFFDLQGNPSGTGIFVPTSYNVTVVSGGQTSTLDATNDNAPLGTSNCFIEESGRDFSLSGGVTGTIVANG